MWLWYHEWYFRNNDRYLIKIWVFIVSSCSYNTAGIYNANVYSSLIIAFHIIYNIQCNHIYNCYDLIWNSIFLCNFANGISFIILFIIVTFFNSYGFWLCWCLSDILTIDVFIHNSFLMFWIPKYSIIWLNNDFVMCVRYSF